MQKKKHKTLISKLLFSVVSSDKGHRNSRRKKRSSGKKGASLRYSPIGKKLRGTAFITGFSAVAGIVLLVLIPLCLVTLFSGSGFNSGSDKGYALPEERPDYCINVPAEISVYLTESGRSATMPFEDYIKGVVAGEMPSSFEMEALRAQAVAARTYSLSKVLRHDAGLVCAEHPGFPVCDSVHCQVYRSPEDLTELKSEARMQDGWLRICEAVDSTAGVLMYYDGKLADQALFHSSSGGRTENSEDVFTSAVPYLRSVDSPESSATHQNEANHFTYAQIEKKLNNAYPKEKTGGINKDNVVIISSSDGGKVSEIRIGTSTYSGSQIRSALVLPSAGFAVSCNSDGITFVSNGYGHGVGMSQYGANDMALAGANYLEILSHYYTGIEIF